MRKNYPLDNGYVRKSHNIQGVETMGQVVRTIPRIYVALEDCQEDYQSTVVEFEGKIAKQFVFILIDPGSTHSYVSPKIVDICAFKKLNHCKSWLVPVATGTNRKVSEIVEECPLDMDGIFNYANLNILPLGSYDILIGMD